MKTYIIIGTRQNVYQDEIGGPFVQHPDKEVVVGFLLESDAEKYIINNKLKKSKKQSFGDTSRYAGGYCDMEIQEVDIKFIYE